MADQGGAQAQQGGDEKTPRRVNWIVVGCVLGLVLIIIGAVFLSFKFVEQERARELQAWQIRLGIVADSRAAAVNEWAEQNFSTLRELAENASLQLYMTELSLAQGDKGGVTDEAAQASYLRNLLVATAERSGFKPPVKSGEVAANIEKVGVAGLGLTDAEGRPLVSTSSMPPLAGRQIRTAVATALEGTPALVDVHMGPSNLPTVGFSLPIYGVQAD